MMEIKMNPEWTAEITDDGLDVFETEFDRVFGEHYGTDTRCATVFGLTYDDLRLDLIVGIELSDLKTRIRERVDHWMERERAD